MQILPIEPLNLPDPNLYSGLSKILIEAISLADSRTSRLDMHGISVEGLSSVKNRCLLNNLLSMDKARYLEIGTYKGASLTSALYNNNPEYHAAIDSFRGFEWMANEFYENCRKVLGYDPNFFNADCFALDPLEKGIKDINIYYYDGNHSREDTAKSLPYYYDCLADEFIYIVDDFNRAEVSTGVFEALRDTDVKIDFVKILPARFDGDLENWWSGVFAASCKKR
jgi:hypothetical protein